MAPVVTTIAAKYGDETIDLVAIEPEGLSYRAEARREEAGPANFEKLSRDLFNAIEVTQSELGATVSEIADVFAIVGSSARWAMWGERDWEVAALLIPAEMRASLVKTRLFFDPFDDFVGELTPIGFRRFLGDDAVAEFRANISALTQPVDDSRRVD